MFATLINLRGNPRACVYTEPLWGIPFSLYTPYATLFMFSLGVRDAQIGLLTSIGMVLQVFTSLWGGVASDKMGRKRTTFIFDVLAWSVPCLLWAFSQNFWWFLIAAIFNSMDKITHNSWNCLLVEDAEPNKLVDIYTWVTVSGLLAVFFAPISGVLVRNFSLIPVVRILYFFSFIFMTLKFVVLNRMATETRQGLSRMEETKNKSSWQMLKEYKGLLLEILASKPALAVLLLMFITNTTSMVITTFFPIYVTKNLLIPEEWIAYFPMARAAIMIFFILWLQGAINRLPFQPVMIAGVIFYIAGLVALLLTPSGSLGVLAIYVVCESIGHALLFPRKDSILILFVDPQKRARVQGLLLVLMIALTAPFGWLTGLMSEANRVLPFIFSIALFIICGVFIIFSKEMQKLDSKSS
ncbi:MAG: MFS transporter [Christensenellales bacterium]